MKTIDEKQFEEIKNVLNSYKSSTYVCSICGNIIFPEVEFEDGLVCLNTERHDIRSIINNTILQKDICGICNDKSRLSTNKQNIYRRDI